MGDEREKEKGQGLVSSMIEDAFFGTYADEYWMVPASHGIAKFTAETRDAVRSGNERIVASLEQLDASNEQSLKKVSHDIARTMKEMADSSRSAEIVAGAVEQSGREMKESIGQLGTGLQKSLSHMEATSLQGASAILGEKIEPLRSLDELGSPKEILDLYKWGFLDIDREEAYRLFCKEKDNLGYIHTINEKRFREWFEKEYPDPSQLTKEQIARRMNSEVAPLVSRAELHGYVRPEIATYLKDEGLLERRGLDQLKDTNRSLSQLNETQTQSLKYQRVGLGLDVHRNRLLEGLLETNYEGFQEVNEHLGNLEEVGDELVEQGEQALELAGQSLQMQEYLATIGLQQLDVQGHMVDLMDESNTLSQIQIEELEQIVEMQIRQMELASQQMELAHRDSQQTRKMMVALHNHLLSFLGISFQKLQSYVYAGFSQVTQELQNIREDMNQLPVDWRRNQSQQIKTTGLQWIADRDYEQAKQDLLEAHKQFSRDFDIVIGLAICEIALGNYDQADKYLRRAETCAQNEEERFTMQVTSTKLEEARHNPEEALKKARRSSKEMKKKTKAQILLAEELLLNNNKEEASFVLQEALLQDPEVLFLMVKNKRCQEKLNIVTDILVPVIEQGTGSGTLYLFIASYCLQALALSANAVDFKQVEKSVLLALQKGVRMDIYPKVQLFILSQKKSLKPVIDHVWQAQKEQLTSVQLFHFITIYQKLYPDKKQELIPIFMEGWKKDEIIQDCLKGRKYRNLVEYLKQFSPQDKTLLYIASVRGEIPVELRKLIYRSLHF
jgi:tetratricopeptide (TPR) repeat protein